MFFEAHFAIALLSILQIYNAKNIKDIVRREASTMDVLNIRQNKDPDKELDLIARQDDQEIKHKNLTEYMELL